MSKKRKEQDRITITVVYDRISRAVSLSVTMLPDEEVTVAELTEALVGALRIAPQLGQQEGSQPERDKEVVDED